MNESESTANKENVNQGNEEVTDQKRSEEEVQEDGLLDEDKFNKKYLKLQKTWIDGHRKDSDLTEDEKTQYGDHAYLLKYCLPGDKGRPDNQEIVFHPKAAYSYLDYEKSAILPLMNEEKLKATQQRFQSHIDRLEKRILGRIKEKEIENKKKEEEEERKKAEGVVEVKEKRRRRSGWQVPKYSIPIRADIREFDFKKLAMKQKQLTGRLFDVIMTDPPWMLASANPTRGVALGYSQLSDDIISTLPIDILQDNGLLFIWVINAKYRLALQLMQKWGYTMIGDVAWVKQTVNRRIANGHGYYLQHAKESCLIGLKGEFDKIRGIQKAKKAKGLCSDVIWSERRGQSQKPEEIYQYIEHLVPQGYYLEIFARRNNLRNGWFSIGNEL